MFYSVNNDIFNKIIPGAVFWLTVKWLSCSYPVFLNQAYLLSLNDMRISPGFQDIIWIFSIFYLKIPLFSFINISYFQMRILIDWEFYKVLMSQIMRLVGPEATDYKADCQHLSLSVSLGSFGVPWDPARTLAKLLLHSREEKASCQWHDLAQHWDSSQHLAFLPKEIPTQKDFNTNIGEHFKTEIKYLKLSLLGGIKRILSL